ncbi:uncharacterized protein LOC143718621 [Siphateles boraxobius]|uniref:uncharacterized protein LOC143718621 n=1 Tax=Siphateles boraxobius TaxID=180520 RepID=UPI0040642378
MVFARAVWIEGDKHFEGVVPKNWILQSEKLVRWPKTQVQSAHKKKLNPMEDWLTFQLVKIKMTSENEKDCELYDYTSSAQTDHENITTMPYKKRVVKKRKHEDYMEWSIISEDDVSKVKNKPKLSMDQNNQLAWSRQLVDSSSEDAEIEIPDTPSPIRERSNSSSRSHHRRQSTSRHVHSTPIRERSNSSSRSHHRRQSTSRHETSRAPTGHSMDVFPMPTSKFQKCVFKKLVEIMQEVKRIGCAEPNNSAYHIRKMELIEELNNLEEKLQNNEERDVLITQLSKVGGKNIRDCTTKILDRLMTNNLMSQLNMKGHGSKTAFQSTSLFTTVIDAIKKMEYQGH